MEVKKAKSKKIAKKPRKSLLVTFGKSIAHVRLKFCSESFLSRIYNFVFLKIFVGSCLDISTKFEIVK